MYFEAEVPGLGVLWQSSDGPGDKVIPADGCCDIILRADELIVAGPSTRRLRTRGTAEGVAVGLRFTPGLAGPVLGIDPQSVRDRIASAHDVLTPYLSRRSERLLRPLSETAGGDGSPRLAEFRATARDALLALDSEAVCAQTAWTREARAAAAGGMPATRLADRLGYSERQLRRNMLGTFGYGYAALRRVLRAERAREALRTGAGPAEAAQRAGYADQPHMTREVQRVLGATPAQLAGKGA